MASTKASAATETAVAEIVNTVVEDDASVGVERFFTIPGRDPFEEVEWEIRDAFIPGKDKPAFDQKDVEFPKFWSQTATNIVAQKYFRGKMGSAERETSVKQMIGRVVDTISGWGRAGGYFATDEEADTFEAELKAILVNQYASFNSPVWFNVGFEEKLQCSPASSSRSTTRWSRSSTGSGARGSSSAWLWVGRQPLAPPLLQGAALQGRLRLRRVSFMRGADASAGTIKSGGKTRRAAKMVVLDVDHPDVRFHLCKSKEEEKARPRGGRLRHVARLAGLGVDPVPERQQLGARHRRLHGGGGVWIPVESHREDRRHRRRYGRRARAAPAGRRLSVEVRRPGCAIRHDDQPWHTCPNTGRIDASNPCSEYILLDDSACNLASLNLMKFRREDGELDVEGFRHAVDVLPRAEIVVDFSRTRQ